MSKFKPGEMARTIADARFPTWSDRTCFIVGFFDVSGVPAHVLAQHPRAVEWYEIEILDGGVKPDLGNSFKTGPGPVDGVVCPDTHLMPIDPPKEDYIPGYARDWFKVGERSGVLKRQKVKA